MNSIKFLVQPFKQAFIELLSNPLVQKWDVLWWSLHLCQRFLFGAACTPSMQGVKPYNIQAKTPPPFSRTHPRCEWLVANAVHDDEESHHQLTFNSWLNHQAEHIVAEHDRVVRLLRAYLRHFLPLAIPDLATSSPEVTFNLETGCWGLVTGTAHEHLRLVAALEDRPPPHRENMKSSLCFQAIITFEPTPSTMHA